MKMTKEDYNHIVIVFQNNIDKVEGHYNYIKQSGKYNVLEVRVGFDCLRAFGGKSFMIDQYDKGLNDDHIKTACVKALKTVLGV
jgi:hypothetical protein